MSIPTDVADDLRAKISDAYYDARNTGRTMSQAAVDAVTAISPIVEKILAEQRDGLNSTDDPTALPKGCHYEWWMYSHPGWPDGLRLYEAGSDAQAAAEFEKHPHPSAFVIRKVVSTLPEVVVPSARYGDLSANRCSECDVDVKYRHVHDREAHGWDGRAPSRREVAE